MSHADFWYIRFPDGRVLRAASTSVLRQELSAHRIPLGSLVRRSPSEEWVSLEWAQEFADLMEHRTGPSPAGKTSSPRTSTHSDHPLNASRRSGNAAADHPATVGSRLDPARLHLVGVRGYLDELLAALDSTLVPKKLLLGLLAGLLLGALFVLARAASFEFANASQPLVWLLLALTLVLLDGIIALLARLTYLELARLRPVHWREGFQGLGRLTSWVVDTQVLVCGAVGALIFLLRWLPFWMGPGSEESWTTSQQIVAGTDLLLGTLLEVLLLPVFFLWWLLPPLLASENCTAVSGLSQWISLLRRNLGLVLLYQAMTVSVGVLATMPFLLLLAPLLLPSFHAPAGLEELANGVRFFLLGLVCAPLLTYWSTANVFIYLNLRYGASSRR